MIESSVVSVKIAQISLQEAVSTNFIGLLGFPVEVPVMVRSNRKQPMNIVQMVEQLLRESFDDTLAIWVSLCSFQMSRLDPFG